MKKIRKLTPATLKRIIAEEKSRLVSEQKLNDKKEASQSVNLEKYIKILRVLKEVRKRKNRDLKKINRLSEAVKKKLLKEI